MILFALRCDKAVYAGVIVWNLEERSCIASLRGTGAVSAVEFVKQNSVLVGYSDGGVSFFSLHGEKKLLHRWNNHTSQIVGIFVSAMPEAVFISRDQTLSVVNIDTMEKIKVLPLFEPIESAVVVQGSLFTVGEEGVLKCWNLQNAKLLKSANISTCRVDTVLYNASRGKFLLATSDFNVFLVHEETFKIERQFVGFNDQIFDICYIGTEHQYLVVATNSADLRLYDTTNWSCRLITGTSFFMRFVLCNSSKKRILSRGCLCVCLSAATCPRLSTREPQKLGS
ncbi:unnamed protein product [Gongylonema pulchrum]|uniref:WD_REPEATS_REGION domain-containing protein n=1 Tax=Gongylonema pulchrum TaxID=637853 RepID=A0A183D6Q6_9BILA|nr:unnamed protein product [Gongylonema pulchrum]